MSDNPFDAGDAPQLFDDRSVDLGQALTGGTGMAIRHAPSFLGSSLILFAAYVASICTCVGILGTAPFLMWGLYAFLLTAADDAPRLDALWSGLEQPGRTFLSGWGMILCLMVVLAPTIGASSAISVAAEQGMVSQTVAAWFPSVVGLVWGLMIAPLTYAPLLWVDGRASVLSAFTMALDAFKGSWGALAAISLLTQVLMLPTTLAGVWVQTLDLESMAPDEVLDLLAPMLGGGLVLYGWLFVAGIVGQCWMAHAYRQVVPRTEGTDGGSSAL